MSPLSGMLSMFRGRPDKRTEGARGQRDFARTGPTKQISAEELGEIRVVSCGAPSWALSTAPRCDLLDKALRETLNDRVNQGLALAVNQRAHRDIPSTPVPSPVPLSHDLTIVDVFVREGETYYLLSRQATCNRVGTHYESTDSWFETYEIRQREMEKSSYGVELLRAWGR